MLTAIICVKLVAGEAGSLSMSEITLAMSIVRPEQWLAALVLTGLSFFVVGQYDALFHRWLDTGVAASRARLSGMAAIAVAQTVGMGLLSGTLARWRCLPEVNITTALKVTNYVSVSFMAALGVIIAAVLLLSGTSDVQNGVAIFAAVAVAVTLLISVLSVLRPRWLPIQLPPIRLMARLTGLAALDVMLAGLALYVLLPGDLVISAQVFAVGFVVALGAGLLSSTPGGIGPFELCLVMLVPTVPKPELIAAILCFRITYYAIPACLAVCVMIRPSQAEPVTANETPPSFPRAEAKGLSQLKDHHLLGLDHRNTLHVAAGAQTLFGMGESSRNSELPYPFARLETEARVRHLWPAVYKVSRKTAAVARRRGWSVAAISEEAWLAPQDFTLDGRKRRQLRRKLRNAETAGIHVEDATGRPACAQMERVAAAWAARAGGERGFTMGRYCPDYIRNQRCFLARHEGRVIAFITFHATDDEWVLDLVRSSDQTPNGTMHALVRAAIEAARAEEVKSLSLAALPNAQTERWMQRAGACGDGLRQFKMSFAPTLIPLYMAAPNPALLALAAVDISLRILRPETAVKPMRFMQFRHAKTPIVEDAIVAQIATKETYNLEIKQ
ncbi:MAG: GNAT family N-acetyltransferase [Pseudomonadota bacterium]